MREVATPTRAVNANGEGETSDRFREAKKIAAVRLFVRDEAFSEPLFARIFTLVADWASAAS